MHTPESYYFGALKRLLEGDLEGALSCQEKAEEAREVYGISFSETVSDIFPFVEEAVTTLLTSYDFTRCVRPDGSAYGSRGKCKKGSESVKAAPQKRSRQEREAAAAATLKRMADKGPSTSVKKEKYSWGSLIKVSKGSDYKAILHPEHQAKLKKLKDGESTKFVDEQNMHWTATRSGNSFKLEGGDRSYGNKPYKLEFDRSVLD